jgi:quercetin dioxygenase-like cupin family protein
MKENLEHMLSYSFDQLNEREKDKFEKEIDKDPESEQELLELQSILEMIALSEQPIEPSKKLKQTLLESLNVATPFQGFVDRFMTLFDLERNKVESLFDKIVNSPNSIFESSVLPKTSLYFFDGGPQVTNSTCGIVKVKAGNVFPAHQHQDKEWIFILQGSAKDQSGIEYLPGDFIVSDKDDSHALRIGKNEDLIFAVVLNQSNKWLFGQIIMDYIVPGRRFKK